MKSHASSVSGILYVVVALICRISNVARTDLATDRYLSKNSSYLEIAPAILLTFANRFEALALVSVRELPFLSISCAGTSFSN